jgi:hypothetical protein
MEYFTNVKRIVTEHQILYGMQSRANGDCESGKKASAQPAERAGNKVPTQQAIIFLNQRFLITINASTACVALCQLH